jgi:hypothetical protein
MVRAEPATDSRASPDRKYGLHKSLYSRWKRPSEKGAFAQTLMGLATEDPEEKTAVTDATYLNTHRTTTSLQVKR